ncbi:hypothetical protein IAR55_007095 [Kwoniella newhampshirensis]|uniref:Vacuolar protein sorting-associated protein 8 central domain-containing protein n=1 Tax=Kwoniella newhampshirensis TaxID=1651941 RepID=A0AAW0YWA6_9TREE
MPSSPRTGPRRQDSAVSSASSGTRTVRAASRSGRSSSAASDNKTASRPGSGLFSLVGGTSTPKAQSDDSDEEEAGGQEAEGKSYDAQESPTPPSGWRSRRENRTDQQEGEVEAGPSDYWKGESPPASTTQAELPSAEWRKLSDKPFHLDEVEDGPSDQYWGAKTPPLARPPHAVQQDEDYHSLESPAMNDYFDTKEYERRLHEILAIDQRATNGEDDQLSPSVRSTVDTYSYHPSGTPLTDSELRKSYKETYHDTMGSEEEKPMTESGIGDEEFGVLDFPPREDSSDRTPSTASLPVSRLKDPVLPPGFTPSPSKRTSFILAKSETMSTGSGPVPLAPSLERSSASRSQGQDQTPAFTFHPLRRVSAHLFSRRASGTSSPIRPAASRKASSVLGISLSAAGNANGDPTKEQLGKPTVMDIRGMIAIGTERGFVTVYGFDQEIKHILGNENLVGRASGNIHLYDLSNPSRAARTTLALTLRQVLSGGREGHLQGSRILHIGFVGARHTSIVTGDEHGRAFWWSLGRVMGVDSNDVVRMLGSYPESVVEASSYPSSRPTTLLSALPLPLGQNPHTTDTFQLSALLTPSKLVIVGMKPSAKTWFRKMRDATGGELGGYTGCAVWLRSGEVEGQSTSDPVLVYSWGKSVRFLRVRVQVSGKDSTPEFVEGRCFEASDPVRALQWYNSNTRLLTAHDFYSGLSVRSSIVKIPESFVGSARTKTNLQVGTLLHWNDRVLGCVHRGDFLGAIQVALSYFEGRATGNLINLPQSEKERRAVIGARLRELMHASLEWAFSPERMTDDTHYSADGRGVDLTSLFEGLATSCIEACLTIKDSSFLFDDAYEHFSQVGIQGVFLTVLEPFIFSGRIREVPPMIIQGLIRMHDEKGELDLAESVIWHVDPICLDINQAITLCEAHGLWDAMIHVYTRAMKDYVAPIVKLIGVVRDIQHHRLSRPSLVGEKGEDDLEGMAPNAYKLYAYMETVLSGLSYPSGESIPDDEAHNARTEVYNFIFQGRTVVWPLGGDLVLTGEPPEPPYPYLSVLLRFDTEAFLHAMDIAFEDPYLNDTSGAINRQSIVNLMLDVMDPEYFHPGDITFLHIFVARNLPKYPQFLFIPPSTLHRILVSLASDPDQSTREDRQLAAEYLLSAYTPHDSDAMLALFEQAGFFRILRSAYRREGKWAQLISTLLRDPESDEEVFVSLDEIIKTASASGNVTRAVVDALPQLFDLGVRQTAFLLDRDLPTCHTQAIDALGSAPHKQLAYLRCLLEPDAEEMNTAAAPPSSHVDLPSRHLYVSLLCQYEPDHVVAFLDHRGGSFFDLERLATQCDEQETYEGQIWALDRQGKVKETFETVGDILRTKGSTLGEALVGSDVGGVHLALQTVHSVARMAVRLCQEHSRSASGVKGEEDGQGEQVEDMWLGVLHEIIELVHSASALGNGSTLDTLVVDTLRSLVQETLASLVSTSSPSLSFPRLFKRLVDASTTTASPSSSNKSKKGRAYSEFRTILTGMLDSYRSEGEMLGMTTKLVEADLYEMLQEQNRRRNRGWGPGQGECEVCGERLFASTKGKDGGDGGGLIVLGSGTVLHRGCFEKTS